MWYGFIGFLSTFVSGYVVSWALPAKAKPVDRALLATFMRRQHRSLTDDNSGDGSRSRGQNVKMDDHTEVSEAVTNMWLEFTY